MALSFFQDRHRSTKLWLVVIALTVITVLISTWFVSPPPPHKIVLATGQPDGAYYAFGKEYEKHLNPMGLEVKVAATNGSIENLQRLLRREADVAFVQGGTYPLVKDQDPQGVLRGLAAVYLEPLWVFYRDRKPDEKPAEDLSAFRGRTISIGPQGSGTEAVSRTLLEAHGLTDGAARLVNLTTAEAVDRLQKKDGDLDVAMFVSSYQAPAIKQLLQQEDVHLLSFRRDIAYARQFPSLTPVKLAEGVLDLQHDVPREEKTLLAPAALLVCRADLHPQVVDQVL